MVELGGGWWPWLLWGGEDAEDDGVMVVAGMPQVGDGAVRWTRG
jgi:hypothetical protein